MTDVVIQDSSSRSQLSKAGDYGHVIGVDNVSPHILQDVGADSIFDLNGWEAEQEVSLPIGDATLVDAAREIQSAISKHQPIDTSSEWEDLGAFLPERASPQPNANDTDVQERLRTVLLRAIREGSVPEAAIEDLLLGDDGLPNMEAYALLCMVINDLGAETDDRFEYWSPNESFEVVVAPEMSSDEEDTVTDALVFLENLAARRNDPLRIYQREFQKAGLLTAEEETAFGQDMERGVEQALDALASWPNGVGAVLDAVRMVKAGEKSLRWLSSGPRVEPQNIETMSDTEPSVESVLSMKEIGEDDDNDTQFGIDAQESTDELSELFTNAALLSGHAINETQGEAHLKVRRTALASLGLSRNFLLELADFDQGGKNEPANAFSHSMRAYRQARDQMVIANLKLVLSIAKKYLYSGQPLDDLIQEGNIGLMKAVDRYDWRRGFKLSTYATWWIRQQVGRHVADKCKTIRLPVHVYEKTQRIAHAAHGIEQAIGRAATVEEIAEKLDMPARKVLALALVTPEPLSIHGLEVDRLIAIDAQDDYVAQDPMDILSERQLIGSIDRLLSTLKPKDAQVLRLRFGIGLHDAMTLEEVGTRFEVTRERIRQIEAKAIRHLKHPARLERLLRELNGNPQSKRDETEVAKGSAPSIEIADVNSTQAVPILESIPQPERVQYSTSTTLDKVLAMATVLGVTVEDDRQGDSGSVWVNILETPTTHSRKLIRKLLDLGFEFWPGKGYWR